MINTPTQYQVVFDLAQTGFQHWFALAGGFIFIAAAVVMFWLARRGARTAGRWAKLQLVPMTIFLAVWSVLPFVWFADKYRNYLHIRTALEQSHCDVVAGQVTQFGHLPEWRKSPGVGEEFAVNGIQFSYREGSAQNGFHQAGIIHDGQQVRISYYDWHDGHNRDIARLEIAP